MLRSIWILVVLLEACWALDFFPPGNLQPPINDFSYGNSQSPNHFFPHGIPHGNRHGNRHGNPHGNPQAPINNFPLGYPQHPLNFFQHGNPQPHVGFPPHGPLSPADFLHLGMRQRFLVFSNDPEEPVEYNLAAFQDKAITTCGPGPVRLQGFTVTHEHLFQNTGMPTMGGRFDKGVFVAPVEGLYHICASTRVREHSRGDYTVNLNSDVFGESQQGHDTVLAAFGSDCPAMCLWSTYKICFNQYLVKSDRISVHLRSGGNKDCNENTSWRYTKFDVFLIRAVTRLPLMGSFKKTF